LARRIVGVPKILGQTDSVPSKTPIFARSTSVVTRSEQVQLTLIGSPLRAYQ